MTFSTPKTVALDSALRKTVDTNAAVLRDQGFVIIPDILDKGQLEIVKSELDPHISRFGRNDFEGKLTQRVYALLRKCPAIAPLVEHPIVTGIVDQFLAPTYLLMICQTADICPGEKAQGLHADDDGGAPPRPRGPNGISVMWALTDFTEANGATRFVPGSHAWDQEKADQASDADTHAAQMKAGSVLIYQGAVLHGGGANHSDQTRRGVSIIYCQPWLRQFENMVLSVPPEYASQYSEKVQRLLGYGTLNGTFIGHTDGRDPINLVREVIGDKPQL
jgi:ectoine hydroxylase-related dioxygenase (phytanoyl-CoA dioxygenase family)